MLRCSIALMLLAAATQSSAQSFDDHDYRLSVNVELVQLPVSVLDKKGFPVRGLQREHFVVYEDRVLQEISFVKQEDVPLSVGLVVDTSTSMSDKLDRLNTAAMTFVRESNPGDETSIVSFADSVNLDQDFTTNTRELRRALQGIVPNGSTSLYDAVFLAAKHLTKEGFREKKVLLIISDGEDNHSKYKLEEVLETIRESKIILYSIGLLGADAGFMMNNGFAGSGRRALKQLAEVTGGAAFFPRSAREVEKVCETIARDLRNQYIIGYRPSNEKMDGSWRKTVVQVSLPKTSPKVRVHTKQGYYAPVAREGREKSRPTLK
jgi:Ca-activated chloride channel family protein